MGVLPAVGKEGLPEGHGLYHSMLWQSYLLLCGTEEDAGTAKIKGQGISKQTAGTRPGILLGYAFVPGTDTVSGELEGFLGASCPGLGGMAEAVAQMLLVASLTGLATATLHLHGALPLLSWAR